MYKNLCIAVLLLAFGLVAMRSTGSPTAGSTPPAIVAKLTLPNQTAAIPTTVLYTPSQTGLFRVSVYMTTPVANESSNYWTLQLGWSDEAGVENMGTFGLDETTSNATPPTAWGAVGSTGLPIGPAVIRCIGGQPITYSVSPTAQSDLGSYSLYAIVERLD
jgi:hypothetical protein